LPIPRANLRIRLASLRCRDTSADLIERPSANIADNVLTDSSFRPKRDEKEDLKFFREIDGVFPRARAEAALELTRSLPLKSTRVQTSTIDDDSMVYNATVHRIRHQARNRRTRPSLRFIVFP
jgi:hypothetical protein